jgi:hypothetical protein
MRRTLKIYHAVVIIITVCSVGAMLYFKNNINVQGVDYDNPTVSGLGDDEYLGYIFEDYNKKVNLGYADNIPPAESDIINTASLSALDMEYTPDNVRAVKSERIVDKRAVMDEILGDDTNSSSLFHPEEIAFFYDSMDQPDKTVFLNVAGKLDQESLKLVKQLFDSVSDDDMKGIVQGLKYKLTDDECEFLTTIAHKYGE